MPITKSAKKALRRDRRKQKINNRLRRKLKEAVKKMKGEPGKENLSQANRVLDRAAKKGLIHKNKAARIKSKLAKTVTKKKEEKKKEVKTGKKPPAGKKQKSTKKKNPKPKQKK